jgi:hypothetical protein
LQWISDVHLHLCKVTEAWSLVEAIPCWVLLLAQSSPLLGMIQFQYSRPWQMGVKVGKAV